jgi:hypothetical protein
MNGIICKDDIHRTEEHYKSTLDNVGNVHLKIISVSSPAIMQPLGV